MPKRNEQASGKRTYGKGSISERRNAANVVTGYQAQVRLDDGRKRSKTLATEREAERWLVEARKLAARGEMSRPGVPTLHAYLTKTWLPTISQSIKWGTRTGYELNVRRLPTELVRMRLDRIKPGDVQTVYNTLTERGLAPASVRQVHAVLHKAFEDALHFGYVSRNPCHGTMLPRMTRAERPWYTDAQIRQLFDATAGDRFHALWVVLGTLGLRNGEARGLMWTDVDWDRSTVNIRRTLYRPGKGSGLILEEPKTTRSRRTVALPAETVEALRAHQDQQEWECRRAGGAWQENGLIFTSDIGTPLEHGRVIRQWREAVEKAGLPKIRVHDLRHSVASNLLSAGRPPERVARMLGHANVTMLLNVYGHIIPSDFRAEADAMQAALSRHREAR